MRYNIGDKFVYPMHGAGIVEKIEEKNVLGENISYYNLKLPYGNLSLAVPVENVDRIGVRNVMHPSEVDKVLKYLRRPPELTTLTWNKRLRSNMDRLRSGDIYEVAEVFKELYLRDIEKNLSSGEKKVMTNSKNILYSEIALACDKSMEDVDALVMGVLANFKKIDI